MKSATKIFTSLFALFLINGCAEFSQHAAESVSLKTVKEDHCTYVGHVLSTGPTPGNMNANNPDAQERHINTLKRKAHDLGANAIVITTSNSNFKKRTSTIEHNMGADAYRCPGLKKAD